MVLCLADLDTVHVTVSLVAQEKLRYRSVLVQQRSH